VAGAGYYFLAAANLSQENIFTDGTTDAKGIARITFYAWPANGMVEIVVTASYNDLKKRLSPLTAWWDSYIATNEKAGIPALFIRG
jgi:hypothetical protein